MAKTDGMAKRSYNLRRANFQQQQPQIQQSRQAPRLYIKVKHIEGRHRNRDIKIKKLLDQFQNIQVKPSGREVRNLTVRQKSMFPAERRQREY